MRALALAAAAAVALGGCSLLTVQQDQFAPLEIRADRPAARPPRVVVTPSSLEITDKVQFAFGSADLLEVSFSLLDDVAQVMIDNPQIELIQVEGHTDNVGGDAANKRLSQQRAESVKAYLTSKGVPSVRLVARGYGEEKPVADNATPEGRDANRRVEFNILKQGPKKTVIEDD